MGLRKLFKKKTPKNVTWVTEDQQQRRREIIEILAVVSMIPIFYFVAVLLLSL